MGAMVVVPAGAAAGGRLGSERVARPGARLLAPRARCCVVCAPAGSWACWPSQCSHSLGDRMASWQGGRSNVPARSRGGAGPPPPPLPAWGVQVAPMNDTARREPARRAAIGHCYTLPPAGEGPRACSHFCAAPEEERRCGSGGSPCGSGGSGATNVSFRHETPHRALLAHAGQPGCQKGEGGPSGAGMDSGRAGKLALGQGVGCLPPQAPRTQAAGAHLVQQRAERAKVVGSDEREGWRSKSWRGPGLPALARPGR